MLSCAFVKVAVSELADAAVARCRSSAGAAGFFVENRLIEYQGLTMAFRQAGGDNRLILLDAAWTIANNRDLPRVDDQPHYEWAGILRARETLLHTELREALNCAGSRPVDFDVWNSCSELALRAANAHLTRITFDMVSKAWPGSSVSEHGRVVLSELFALACLEHVEESTGTFLALGLLTPAEALAVPEQINAICRRLVLCQETIMDLLEVLPRCSSLTGGLSEPLPEIRH
jgi:acyl-CoA oxidase